MPIVTEYLIREGLTRLGLSAGSTALVHSSLSNFGHVEGGADAVIDALLGVIGPAGTILVPTLTGNENLSPENPPVFDPVNTPCWTGRIPETFRKRPDAIRSVHPTHSVAAIGADAMELTRDHILSITPCDEFSPYGKLARREDGYILLIGVDHDVNTTMHHVEEIAGVDYHMQRGFAESTLIINGTKIIRHYMLHRYGAARNFSVMGPIFVERGIQWSTRIGDADVHLIQAKPMVEITCQCLRANPRILYRE